jgi:hypothetical protein
MLISDFISQYGGGGGGDVAPIVVSCTCPNSAPNTLVYVFSQSMTAVTVAGHTAKKNGSAWNHVSVTGSGTTWTFTMPSAAALGDTLLRSYDSTTGATIGTSLELVSFTDSSVTNSVAGSYQTESTAFFAVNTGLTTPEKDAVDALVVTMKSIGWSKFKVFYPNIGGTAAAHKWNLINPLDTDGAFRATYGNGNGGVTHSATGIAKTGTASSINSHMSYDTDFALDDCHVGVHVRGTTSGGQIAGAWNTAVTFGLGLANYYAGTDVQAYYNDLNAGVISATGAVSGHYGLNRSSSTSLKAFKNGAQTGSTYVTANSGTKAGIEFYFGCVNWQGTGGWAGFEGEITVCHAGTTLTDGEWATLNTAISTFNTAISR